MIKNEQERQRIGSRIAELRKTVEWTDAAGIRRTGMTQTDLAQITGLTRTHILRIEQGKYSVGLDYLAAIAEALGCEIDFINK